MSKPKITRRTFLVQMGVVAAGGTLAACGGAATPAPAPPAKAPEPTKAPAPTSAPAAQPTAAPAATKAPPPTPAPVAPTAAAVSTGKYKEAPALAEQVKAGKLPPVDKRLPDEPFVAKPMEKVGKYGGKLSSIVADPTADLMEIEGSMGRSMAGRPYDLQTIIPWAVKSWKLSDDRKELAVQMRKGLNWSDGKPLTTADVMFWYNDIFLNTDLTPKIDGKWAPGGKPMVVKASDDYNFTITFSVPYPAILDFLPNLNPWAPKHYLSQWHIKYNDKANEQAKSEKFDTWVQAFSSHANLNQGSNCSKTPSCPSSIAWAFEKQDQQGNRTYGRNPYYWMVDTDGNQLPYADTIERTVVENKEVLTAKDPGRRRHAP